MLRPSALACMAVLAACAPVAQHGERAPATAAAVAPGPTTTRAVPPGVIADQIRLFQVSYPLLRAATPWCKDQVTHGMGLFALNRHAMGIYASSAWRYGIGEELRALAVVPGGPAHRAGVMAGDVISSINGEPTPTTPSSMQVFGLRMAAIARSGAPVKMTVSRSEQPIVTTVQPERLCAYQVRVAEAQQVNARADGRRSIQITRGMLDYVASDSELALVIAHEIAHNAMGHLEARSRFMQSLAAAGEGAKAVVVNPAFSQALEMEADHLALYMVARAGMSIDAAPALVARLAGDGKSGLQTDTHPAGKARVAALRRTIAEIERKKAAGVPLVP